MCSSNTEQVSAANNDSQRKRIFFDVDYTLLGVDGSLRPGARDVLARLRDDGYRIYVWSGNGIRWRDIRKHGLESLVEDCLEKPVADYVNAVQGMKDDSTTASSGRRRTPCAGPCWKTVWWEKPVMPYTWDARFRRLRSL